MVTRSQLVKGREENSLCGLGVRGNSDGTGFELEGQRRPSPTRATGHTLLIAFPRSSE